MSRHSECDEPEKNASPYSRDQILAAIRWVESGDVPRPRSGDGGRAIGPFQIHYPYYIDGMKQLAEEGRKLSWRYYDMLQKEKAEEVVGAYMRRYCLEAWLSNDAEALARCHNSGPSWEVKRAKTEFYWEKVKNRLESTSMG